MTIKSSLAGMAATLALVAFAHPGVALAASQDRCDQDDLACRMDRLERQLDLVLTYLQRLDRNGPAAQGPAVVEMNTSEYCGTNNCVQEAARLCRAAGFARGVPVEVQPSTFGGHLTRATCMD
ncbi:hypothetical protein GVN24_30205 [Rhizobium sp. CRIBSB]|nr:hypothetical protein [Rhizobium sp. CRIBSB]